jgi:hypothetical protein
MVIFKGRTLLLSMGPGTLEQLRMLAVEGLGGNGNTGHVIGTTPLTSVDAAR